MYLGNANCGCKGLGNTVTTAQDVAKGAAGGAALGPIGAAAGAILGLTAGLLTKKPPTISAFGFHVDDYASHIVDSERQIANLMRAIADITHTTAQFPSSPWPADPASSPNEPGFGSCKYAGIPCGQWASALRPILSKYGQNPNCVADKNQVAPGGCYEQVLSAQLQTIQGLTQQLQQAQAAASQPTSSPGSPVNPIIQQIPGAGSNLPAQYQSPQYQQPGQYDSYTQPMIQPGYAVSPYYAQGATPSMAQQIQPQAPIYIPGGSSGGGPITITTPSAMGSDASSMTPILIGFGALFFLMMLMKDGKK